MAEIKRQRLCTVDHAAKQVDAIGWCNQRFWLNVARRRMAGRNATRQCDTAIRAPARDEASG